MKKIDKVKKKFQGLKSWRYKDNPLEFEFALAWQEKHSLDVRTFAYLMDPKGTIWPDDPTDKEMLVANTLIQWLGSPVGQSFLRDVLLSKPGIEFIRDQLMSNIHIVAKLNCCCDAEQNKYCGYHFREMMYSKISGK